MPNNGYIGRSPGDAAVIVARESFTPGAATTDFTFASGYTVGYIDCYLNGSRLIYGTDYTASNGTTVGLTSFAQSGDVVELVAYKAFNVGNVETASGNFSVGNKLTVSGVSSFTDVVSSGIITADSFSGNLTGSTVSSSGPLTISDATASTSTSTGALIVSGGVGIGKSLFVAEGVSLAGTITYNDVTNIDSIGIVTGGKGLRATTGGLVVSAGNVKLTAGIASVGAGVTISSDFIHLTDNSKIQLGIASDLTIQHNGSNSVINNTTGQIRIAGDDLRLMNKDEDETYATFANDGAATLYNDNSAKLNTAGAGVSITGGVQVSSGGTFGSHNANAAVYYGDGSNLTGIAQGVSGINTTGFSTFKDVSIQGITTFSNLTDASSTTSAAVVISGGVGIAKSMYVGGNIHFANGKGIDFAAVSNGSGTTDNEVLKQYEYGTWTPQDDGDSDISTGIGNYCLVGQVCYLVASFNSNNPSGSTTHIRNLPVNPRRLAYNHHTFGLLFKIPGGGGDESGLSLYICAINTHSTSGGFHIVTDHSDFANTDYSGFNATYTIDQM